MKGELTVEKDRSVTVKGLYQWPTYGGLLEGLPHDKMNERILNEATANAKRHCGDQSVFVIEPIQAPIPYEGKYPFGNPMSLPSITCVADLTSYRPARNNGDASGLTVVWFQNDYAFPIESDILAKLKDIPWSKFADDFDF